MISVNDLATLYDLYYIGHLVDDSTAQWADLETTQLIVLEYNNGCIENNLSENEGVM